MSAAENKKLMEDIYAGLAKRDPTLFTRHVADDVVMRVTGSYSWSRTFTGKEQLYRELYGHLRTIMAEQGATIGLNFVADGDYVVVEGQGRMTTKAGVEYNNEYCMVYRLASGMIVEFREYCDSILTESVLGKLPPRETDAA